MISIIFSPSLSPRRAYCAAPWEEMCVHSNASHMVTTAADRGARLIQQLLAFARRQPLDPTIVNLGTL